MLYSELVKGEVVVGVRPSLPVEDINVILRSNLAGEHVWPVVSPPLVVSAKPSFVGIPNESAWSFPRGVLWSQRRLTMMLQRNLSLLSLLSCYLCPAPI